MTLFTRPRTQVRRRSFVTICTNPYPLHPINVRRQTRRNYNARAMIYDAARRLEVKRVRETSRFIFTRENPIFATSHSNIARALYTQMNIHIYICRSASLRRCLIKYLKRQNCAGRGCGGRIFNYGGRFTSPLYPSIYRNNTVCTWDVSVPRGLKIILEFLIFDIGTKKNCDNNNVKVYDVLPNEELLHGTYCGGVSSFVK